MNIKNRINLSSHVQRFFTEIIQSPIYEICEASRRPFNKSDGHRFIPTISFDSINNTFRNHDVLMELIARIKPTDKKFIDIGCGFPWISLLIKELFPNIECFGLDDDEFIYKVCKLSSQTNNIHFIYSDLRSYNFDSFDVLYCYQPIKSSVKMNNALIRIKEQMKDEARLVAFVDSPTSYLIEKSGFTKNKTNSWFDLMIYENTNPNKRKIS